MASRSTRSTLLPKRSSRENLRSMYVSKERPPSSNSMRISISLSSRPARNLRVSRTPLFQSVVSPRANDPKTPIRRTPRLLIRSRCFASAPGMAVGRKHAVSSPIYVSVQFFEVFLGQFQDVFFRSMKFCHLFRVFPQPDHHSFFPGFQGLVELDCRVVDQSSVAFYRHCPHSMDHSCRREN
jgi:hypothetical protein